MVYFVEEVTHILMRRCNPTNKPEKPEKGVVEGNVMLAGREPAGHGHSHAIPATVTGDSGFELSEGFSSFSPFLSTRCLRA